MNEKKGRVIRRKQIPEKIGGWLLLVAVGIVVTPIRIVTAMATTCREIFSALSTGAWEALTSIESQQYNPFLVSIIAEEIVINCVLAVVWSLMAYKFFTRKKEFPRWYIATAVFTFVLSIADAFAGKLILPNEPLFDQDARREFLGADPMEQSS